MNTRQALETIYSEHGTVTPELVVEAARDPESPLHKLIDWDDTAAAHRWRLEQAASLIRRIRITRIDDDGRTSSVREYHIVRRGDTPPHHYARTVDILADPLAHRALVAQMERDWRAFKARYRHLQEFHALMATESPKPEAAA